jgi:Mg2+-importing ATPase
VPFDFESRRMSVLVSDQHGKTQMITKGAIEEMLKISSYVEYDENVLPLTMTCVRLSGRKSTS